MRDGEVVINLEAPWKRGALLVLMGLLLIGGFHQIVRRVRITHLAYAVNDIERLRAVLKLNPHRAATHIRLGLYRLYDPFLYDPVAARRHLERAVQLEPFQARAWWTLARAYEQQGDLDRAERAYRTSIALAPHHFYPHWMYANFLLRRGFAERAFQEFRQVAEIFPGAMGSICQFIWETTGGDATALVRFGQEIQSDEARDRLCRCLMGRKQYLAATDVWHRMTPGSTAKATTGRALIAALQREGDWALAHRLWRELVREEQGDVSADDLAFWNGDFELEPSANGFGWTIRSSAAVRARLDVLEHHRGRRSLLLEFTRHEWVRFEGVSHILWVEPSRWYRLEFFYKGSDLPEVTGLSVILSDLEAPRRFTVQSRPLGPQRRWTPEVIVFQTPPETRLVRLQIVRRPVGELYDYIEGRVWFDSFRLRPLEAGPLANGGRGGS